MERKNEQGTGETGQEDNAYKWILVTIGVLFVALMGLILYCATVAGRPTPTPSPNAPVARVKASTPAPQARTESLDDVLAPSKARQRGREADVARRIPLRRRREIYRALSRAFDAGFANRPAGTDPVPYVERNLRAVCKRHGISYGDGDTIREEGDSKGWPRG